MTRHLVTLFGLFVILPLALGCSGQPPKLPDAEDIAAVQRDVADAQAKVAELAKKVEAAKAKAIKTAHDTIATVRAARSLAISTGVVPRELEDSTAIALQHAESVLGRYERGEPVSKEELLGAVDAVGSVVRELKKLGRQVEPLVESSLDLVRQAIEGV
jgi:hypothetical protein